jgi:hypothetical protein
MNKIQRIDLVIVPRRGRTRTYALSPLTIDRETFDYICGMMEVFERRAKKYSVPIPKKRNENVENKTHRVPVHQKRKVRNWRKVQGL